MRTLVISDIHGNIDALSAIDEPADRIIFLGDAVDYGPEPAACIDLLRQWDVTRIRGNHDNAVAFRTDCGCGEAFRHLSVETREYMWQILSDKDTAWLGAAKTVLDDVIDGRRIHAVHGAPSDPLFKYLPPGTHADEVAREAALTDAGIILMGHTHKPFRWEIGAKLLVNVGSVGQPRDGIPMASYAVIEDGEVELKRVGYDVERAAARVMGLPLSEQVKEQLVYILMHADTPPLSVEET